MNTDRQFADGEPIPFPSYRCTATARKAKSSYTHRCRRHVDHDGDHSCVCTVKWAKKARRVMGAREQKTHRLTLVGYPDGSVGIQCARGDLTKRIGMAPTPDEVAREADAHWGSTLREVR